MFYRTFTGHDGLEWEVWVIRPIATDKRQSRDDRRRLSDRRFRYQRPGEERRSGLERRSNRDRREILLPHQSAVPSDLAEGWLCFAHGRQRRRLIPIPKGWIHCPDSELADMCARAKVVEPGVSLAELLGVG